MKGSGDMLLMGLQRLRQGKEGIWTTESGFSESPKPIVANDDYYYEEPLLKAA